MQTDSSVDTADEGKSAVSVQENSAADGEGKSADDVQTNSSVVLP